MNRDSKEAVRAGIIAVFAMAALIACGSSSTSTGSRDGGASGSDSPSGTMTGSCTYTLGVLQCETYTGTAGDVSSEIKACERVFGGTAGTSCPTTGVTGYCKNITTASAGEVDEIFYLSPDDGGTLSLKDLCDSSAGTFSMTP